MGIDRFVKWNKAERPTFDMIKNTLEDYHGDAAVAVEVNDDDDPQRIIARLFGAPRYPFRRHVGFEKYAPAVEQHTDRWFEVFVEKNCIDVITRQTDEYINVVAEGFAQLCRRCWNGKRV